MSGVPMCNVHPSVAATGTCVKCMAPICDVCTTFTIDGTVCVRCASRALAAQRRTRLVMLLIALAVLGAASPMIYRVVKKKADDMASGAPAMWTGKLAPLADALEKEPCDRQKIVTFCDELLQKGEPRYCLRRADQFFAQCGDYLRLRWLTYEGHKRLSEFDLAVAEVDKLIADSPDDKDYRWWRGIAYEQKGDFAKAAEDYEQTLRIAPNTTGIPFNLAAAYVKLGRPCDGIFPLEQFAFYHGDIAQNARRRLQDLYDDPKCQARMGTGKATIRLGTSSRQVMSKVSIKGPGNNAAVGEFLIDTGASTVVLAAPFADKLGLAYKKWETQRVLTASGTAIVHVGYLDEIALQGVSAHHVECAVIEGYQGGDGLLGLSFLSRFDMKMNAGRGVLELEQKKR